jgi:tetratricopeptide (TPR) repeat protein
VAASCCASALTRRLQERGNEALKRGSAFYQKQAADFYTQAIEQRSGNAAQNSVYYANRAHTQLQLKNWGKALADARAAVQLNPGNVKARACATRSGNAAGWRGLTRDARQACWRGAKAAAELGRHADVLELCEQALQRTWRARR